MAYISPDYEKSLQQMRHNWKEITRLCKVLGFSSLSDPQQILKLQHVPGYKKHASTIRRLATVTRAYIQLQKKTERLARQWVEKSKRSKLATQSLRERANAIRDAEAAQLRKEKERRAANVQEAERKAQERAETAFWSRVDDDIRGLEMQADMLKGGIKARYTKVYDPLGKLIQFVGGSHESHLRIWETKTIVPKVSAALTAARAASKRKDIEAVRKHCVTAAKKLQYGAKMLDWWDTNFHKGGKGVITGIKFTATVATTALSGGANIGVLGAMGVATAGEAAKQATTLIARAAGGDNVGAKDFKKAAISVALAGGSAAVTGGVAKLASAVTRRIVTKVGFRVLKTALKRPPTHTEVKAVHAFIEKQVYARVLGILTANVQRLVKNRSGINKIPESYNHWVDLVAPGVGGNPGALIKLASAGKA